MHGKVLHGGAVSARMLALALWLPLGPVKSSDHVAALCMSLPDIMRSRLRGDPVLVHSVQHSVQCFLLFVFSPLPTGFSPRPLLVPFALVYCMLWLVLSCPVIKPAAHVAVLEALSRVTGSGFGVLGLVTRLTPLRKVAHILWDWHEV